MKGYKHLTPAEKENILRLFDQLGHTTLVAEKTGYTYGKIQHTLEKAGKVLGGGRVGTCQRNHEVLVQWCKDGLSLSEIARRLGTNHSRVSEYVQKHSIPLTVFSHSGSNNPAWNGGRYVDKSGYILIHSPEHEHANNNGYVREHRLVMEKLLGRTLLPTEVVHHIDDNPQNNDPKNLELFSSNGQHLSKTLVGKCPNWTEEGKNRILASIRQPRYRRASSIHEE